MGFLAVERAQGRLSAAEAQALRFLFTFGEMKRGAIQRAAGVQRRQATTIISRLMARRLAQSDSPKGALRLRISAPLARALLPEFFD